LAHLDWRLTCVGSVERDTEYVAKLMARCSMPPLRDRVVLAGELAGTALDAAYDLADLFVLPTHYEGYGMVVAEALSRAIPVVSTPTGAIAELVGDAAGVLVPSGDAGALAEVLASLMTDREQLARLRRGAVSRRASLSTWQSAVELMEKALERLAPR
ncbi:MAG: glycosyltransferase family 4 protein, partial [Vicinamibacterales bacterium]